MNGQNPKEAEYLMFIEWIALPSSLRAPKTQKELAKKLGVDAATLSDWKRKEDFYLAVSKRIRGNLLEDLGTIMSIFLKEVLKSPKANDIRLLLDYIVDLNRKIIIQVPDEPQELTEEELAQLRKSFKHSHYTDGQIKLLLGDEKVEK